jgi:hypothetical protein
MDFRTTNMLAQDPGKYPKTNPLIDSGVNAQPPQTIKQYYAFLTNGTLPIAAPTTARTAVAKSPSWLPVAITAGVVGLLVIATIVALVVVRQRRRARIPSK